MNLPMHAQTNFFVSRFIDAPKHSLLLHGKPGSGKKYLSRLIAVRLLAIAPDDVAQHPYILTIDPDEPTISIESIRSLQQFLKLRVPDTSKRAINRLVCIYDAERMRHEAQNALLKTLEEPPTGTSIILTTRNQKSLLPTITSRTHGIEVLPIDLQTAINAFPEADTADLKKYHALSQGQAELLYALLSHDSHPLLSHINNAKSILSEKKGQRLLRTEEIAKDKSAARQLAEAFLRISHAGLIAAAAKNSSVQLEQWYHRQEAILRSLQRLDQNANTKLVLDDLFLEL